jgi:hypothetical protein
VRFLACIACCLCCEQSQPLCSQRLPWRLPREPGRGRPPERCCVPSASETTRTRPASIAASTSAAPPASRSWRRARELSRTSDRRPPMVSGSRSKPTTATPSRSSTWARPASSGTPPSRRGQGSGRSGRPGTPSGRCRMSISASASRRTTTATSTRCASCRPDLRPRIRTRRPRVRPAILNLPSRLLLLLLSLRLLARRLSRRRPRQLPSRRRPRVPAPFRPTWSKHRSSSSPNRRPKRRWIRRAPSSRRARRRPHPPHRRPKLPTRCRVPAWSFAPQVCSDELTSRLRARRPFQPRTATAQSSRRAQPRRRG